MSCILLVEDDKTIAMGIEYALTQEGFTVEVCHSAGYARERWGKGGFSLVILDVSLPDGNGFELCREFGGQSDTPVIFLTACDEEVNVVMGLDMGADDYITKPFRVRELVSRIKSVLRRYNKSMPNNAEINLGKLIINTAEAKVYKDGEAVLLTALEYRLLLTLANSKGLTLTRNQILEGLWDVAGDFVNDNTLTVYIKRLREKIEDDPQQPQIIKTVRGLGYKVGE
ncbi:response regulator transcription factor [Dethiobacter alkaliphilus]|uniref:Two component transcriptional regulator, winged helix family n=1 Tax=Dethiobacter alkaliphilus AHT 1 TaxID=555088 RepID=C0GKV4_DETAL|nr:response regulator transcription factor [Dethiobacter alkaliphilus]EEG76036.1 two component transcriptional regulator, winged helix family [Dethiobacter alkaliphilus AHT 1]